MKIPDRVTAQANYLAKPLGDARAAHELVAEWARKETLLEAATAVENIARHPRVGGSGIRLQDVIHTIRSLAGGDKA